MGADREGNGLQEVMGSLKAAVPICAALLFLFCGGAQAQVIPFRGTLAYSAREATWPVLTVKAANGSRAYLLMLKPTGNDKDFSHIDLVLLRPRAKPDASNLLEPEYRWHGLQEFSFNGSDFMRGPEKSIFGKSRHIRIRRRKLDVTFSVVTAKVRPAEKSVLPEDYVFEELVIDVGVDNAK